MPLPPKLPRKEFIRKTGTAKPNMATILPPGRIVIEDWYLKVDIASGTLKHLGSHQTVAAIAASSAA
jgi:hypothetical protein